MKLAETIRLLIALGIMMDRRSIICVIWMVGKVEMKPCLLLLPGLRVLEVKEIRNTLKLMIHLT